jgi:hypothetical protein
LSLKKSKIRISFGNLYIGSTVQYLLKYSNRYRQGGQKEEKARPRPSEKNPRLGARETGARSASGLGAHELLNMFGLEPMLGSQPGAMPSAPGVPGSLPHRRKTGRKERLTPGGSWLPVLLS